MIFDTFTFYNELEILRMRFEVLYDHVDYFVIVEANQTFTLKHSPKEMTFFKNREMFSKYLDKIIHVPLYNEFHAGNPWRNEYHQRDMILRGIRELNGVEYNLRREDIIIMSDVDEIPDPSLFFQMQSNAVNNKVVTFKQKMFRYFLNCQCTHELWKGSRAINYKHLCDKYNGSLEKVRHVDDVYLEGGWHYTGMGGVERFIKKMQSFSHADICDTPEYTDIENMKNLFKDRVLGDGKDVHHFNNATYEVLADPAEFLPPQCKPEDYKSLIFDENTEF